MPVDPNLIKKLTRQEEVTTPGANVLTPKQEMLNASDVQAKHPDKRVRWVSMRDAQKIESRKMEGYKIIPSEEGGRRLGDDLVLMELPREVYEAKVKQTEKLNEQRLRQHRDEMERVVEGVVKQLRDRHGIQVDTKRILVEEG